MINYLQKLLLVCFLLPTFCNASNEQVLNWTQQTLLKTLTLNYKNLDNQLESVKPNYTPEAWEDLRSFLGDKFVAIRDNQLVLHPTAIKTRQLIVQQGFENIIYWRVNQGIKVPELNLNLYFSAVVVKSNKPSYLIQSLTVTKESIN
ncbi:protein IcmL (DotI) [Legionella beliardensis]|uniref:Protein IcmL (DotI) n=1 Tax=Legionella beliardensis TaxID=91822 RepID=A0A378HZT4_9GAMM|nr:DotI/IcmL family type IV secretion protein [Legionella beliardensis]STX27806.1 protein IcmL (DotI) [Legionella beliardensis]